MMQSVDLWEGDNLARGGRVCWAGLRTVLVERKMSSRPVVILKIRRQNTAQVTLIKDDDVIETLAADRADEALDVGVLPW
jgi:hypothetical protein